MISRTRKKRIDRLFTNGHSYTALEAGPAFRGLRRVKSKFLPLRETREQAQADLDRWAKARELEEVPE